MEGSLKAHSNHPDLALCGSLRYFTLEQPIHFSELPNTIQKNKNDSVFGSIPQPTVVHCNVQLLGSHE